MKCLLCVIALMSMVYVSSAHAGTITLDAVDRGWYGNDGSSLPNSLSYFVGNSQLGGITRNWFVFDLSVVDQPIVSAELHIYNFIYDSPDPTETYTLFDVTTDPMVLMNGTGGIPAFNDLGSGSMYSSHLTSSADDDSFIDIILNDAALGSLNETAGQWAVAGSITTLDNDPLTRENIFSGTEILPLNFTQLIVTTIPAPAALPLLIIPVLFRGRRRS